MVNGRAIGDCTVEEVERAASGKEREARFMRSLISGLPPKGGVIRDYRTPEEAEALWARASAEVTGGPEPAGESPRAHTATSPSGAGTA